MKITGVENYLSKGVKRTNLQIFQSPMIRPKERIRALNRHLQENKLLPMEAANLKLKYLGSNVLGDYVTVVDGNKKGMMMKLIPSTSSPEKTTHESVVMQGTLEGAVLKLLKNIQNSTLESNAFKHNVREIKVPDLNHIIKSLFCYTS